MILEKFNLNKLYRFNKNKTNGGKWTELAHNLIVDVEDEYIGTIKVNGEECIIFPKWCDEIQVQCTSTEKGNIYKENTENFIITPDDVYKKLEHEFLSSSKLPSFENFFGSNDYFIFKKEYIYVFDIMNVPNEEIEPWMFKIDNNKPLTIVNENKAIIMDNSKMVREIKRDWATSVEIFQEGVQYELVYDFIDIEDRMCIKINLESYDGEIVTPISKFQAELDCNGEIITVKRSWCIEHDNIKEI